MVYTRIEEKFYSLELSSASRKISSVSPRSARVNTHTVGSYNRNEFLHSIRNFQYDIRATSLGRSTTFKTIYNIIPSNVLKIVLWCGFINVPGKCFVWFLYGYFLSFLLSWKIDCRCCFLSLYKKFFYKNGFFNYYFKQI